MWMSGNGGQTSREHIMLRGPDSVAFRNSTPGYSSPALLDELARLTARLADRRVQGDLATALQDVLIARRLVAEAGESDRGTLQYALPNLLSQWARVYELMDDVPNARLLLHEMFDVANLTDDTLSARVAASRLAWLSAVQGWHGSATTWVRRAEETPSGIQRHDAETYLAEALRLADQLDLRGASAAMASRDRAQTHRESWAAVLFVEAHITDAAGAHVILDRLLEAEATQPAGVVSRGMNLTLLTHAKVRLHLLVGDSASAMHTTEDLPDEAGLQVARAAALLAADQNQAVLTISGRIRPRVKVHPRWRTKLAVIEGVALVRIGAADAAHEVAGRALEAAARLGLYSSLTLLSQHDLRAFSSLLDGADFESMATRVFDYASNRSVVRLSRLSRKERAVLVLVGEGLSVEAMAGRLFVSKNTVKTQVSSIYRKLAINSREEAAAIARAMPPEID